MKLGPLTIERNRPQNAALARPQPSTAEIGAPGTQIFGGWMQQQDYNPELSAPACYDIYDKMRKSDGQVRAGLAVMKLPILRAHWEVEAASDKPEDKMIAEFIEKDLRTMSSSFTSFLRQALLMFDYGSHAFEPCWRIGDDGLVHLRKLAPRHPRSIMKWKVDENGGFAGVQQSAIKASGFSLVDIPPEKLIVYVNDQEGANFRGESTLRAAYKHWYYKDGHYRIDAIANERRGVGLDIMTMKAGTPEATKVALKPQLERAAMTLHAHDKQYFVEDEENYSYRLETGGARGGMNAILATIEHHDLRILRSILAEFLNMGSGSTGSLAMHSDKTGFFLMALEAASDNVADTTSTYLIKPWVDYNWRVTEYPRMKYSRLDTRDTVALADAVNKLVSVNALTPDEPLEDELRAIMDLPDRVAPRIMPPDPADNPAPDPEMDPEREMDAVTAIQKRQRARVLELLAAGKSVDDIRLPYKDELVEAIAAGVA